MVIGRVDTGIAHLVYRIEFEIAVGDSVTDSDLLYIDTFHLYRARPTPPTRVIATESEIGLDAIWVGGSMRPPRTQNLRNGIPGNAVVIENDDTVPYVDPSEARYITLGANIRLWTLPEWSIEFWFAPYNPSPESKPVLFSYYDNRSIPAKLVALRFSPSESGFEFYCGALLNIIEVPGLNEPPYYIVVTKGPGSGMFS